jgi:hypothetical protein
MSAAIPTDGLPDADYLMQRLGLVSSSLTGPMNQMFSDLVPILLDQLAKRIESIFPSKTFYSEQVYVSGKLNVVATRYWPVLSVQKCLLGGTVQMRVGSTPIQVAQSLADVSPSNDRQYLYLANFVGAPCDLYVDYSAGMDVLPPDLLEVFVEMAALIWKEKDRIGQKDMKIGEGSVAGYTRELPKWCNITINNYRRMVVWA